MTNKDQLKLFAKAVWDDASLSSLISKRNDFCTKIQKILEEFGITDPLKPYSVLIQRSGKNFAVCVSVRLSGVYEIYLMEQHTFALKEMMVILNRDELTDSELRDTINKALDKLASRV